MQMSADDRQDAAEVVECFIRLADEDADRVASWLKSVGIEPGTTIPRDAALKLAVCSRLRLWESVGIIPEAESGLPRSEEILSDLITELSGGNAKFPTADLCQTVTWIAFHRLVWPQSSGSNAFLVEDRSSPTEFLDAIAELVWEFRDLATEQDVRDS